MGDGGFGTLLRCFCDKNAIFDSIFKEIAPQCPVFWLGDAVYDTQILLCKFMVLDLLIHNPKRLCIFGGNHNTAGIAVDAVAQRRGKGMLCPGIPLVFGIEIGLNMIDQGFAIFRTVMGVDGKAGAFVHQQNVFVLMYNL